MSALLHPVGPRPPRVYWLRRVVALVAVAAVVALALVLGNALVGGSSADGATADPSAAADPGSGTDAGTGTEGDAQDGSTDTGDGPVACTPEQLSLSLTADARTYPAGSNPVFTVAITNVGDSSCTVDAGELNRQILVSSGSDRIWASTDCPADTSERILLLAAGARDESAYTWPRVRSDEACSEGLPAPRAGTYTATASLAGASSTAAVFDLQD
ncbi:hypothetical protein OEB99_02835 [Actinotalea sp. M2MS4P-6]|uniref:hypothetical protein n=1 Tax=Actinotalea sp. M2MS4P-6 TaxID=2983762 RepID=UPI0021E364FC|nr:hypothetical protein [Actinotalea sp. M2MS4P-6]MCV2393234.1 hypothetical protein [Actinotalea sp. M2MS4P-6]